MLSVWRTDKILIRTDPPAVLPNFLGFHSQNLIDEQFCRQNDKLRERLQTFSVMIMW